MNTRSGNKSKKTDEAAAAMENAQPDSTTETPNPLAIEILEKAKTALDAGEQSRAKQLFQTVIEIHPTSREAVTAQENIDEINSGDDFGPLSTLMFIIIGLGIWGFIIFGVAAAFDGWGARAIWKANWVFILLAVVGFFCLTWMVIWAEKKYPLMEASSRNSLIVFGAIPIIIIGLSSILILELDQQQFVLEMTFLIILCALPAATYYLFLKSRRLGILNEFMGNLGRFSLYEQRIIYSPKDGDGASNTPRKESRPERQLRVEGYLQRFEAIYGSLRFEDETNLRTFTKSLIEASQPENAEPDQNAPVADSITMPTNKAAFSDIFQVNLVIPLGLVTILTGIGWMLAIHPVLDNANANFRITVDLTPVNFAFFGAYFFGIQLLFRRFVTRDLGPNAFMAFAVRIIMAVIAVWVAALCIQILDSIGTKTDVISKIPSNLTTSDSNYDWPPILLVLAFIIGFFPQVLWQVIKSVFSKFSLVSIVVPSTEQDQPLSRLDGLTIWHAARLEEEDVENVGNMATVDVVDIALRTQIPAERLVLWIDQAILYSVLGTKRSEDQSAPSMFDKLRKLGIRNASQYIANYYNNPAKNGALFEALGGKDDKTNPIHTIAQSIEKEANFNLVRAWRGV